MTPALKDLLFLMRQHHGFEDLLNAVESPAPKTYSPSKAAGIAEQQAEWIFRSGRRAQQDAWQSFLTNAAPDAGGIPETSQTEKS